MTVSLCRHQMSISYELLCVSFESVDSDACGDQLVEMEAISNCENKKWSSFLCMLGLATVTKRKMFSYYPDCGENRFQLLFNCLIEPHPPLKPYCDDLNVLFCFDGEIESGETFKPNHFVPLLFGAVAGKRKLSKTSSNVQKKQHSDISSFFQPSGPRSS